MLPLPGELWRNPVSPVHYEIPNVYEISGDCPYCGGTGWQPFYGASGSTEYRSCQFCIKPTCLNCGGAGCDRCVGTKRTFHSDLIQHDTLALPDTNQRPYADGAQPRPPRFIQRSRR